MDKDYLILKRASASRSSGEWNDDDYDVLADGAVVGRILKKRKRKFRDVRVMSEVQRRIARSSNSR
jgi:hypothetical protein